MKMAKKVCIVTWYSSNNYGTCLQALALNNILRNQGYQTYMLRYGRRYTIIDLGRVIRKVKKRVKESKESLCKTNPVKELNVQKFVNEQFEFLSVKDKKSYLDTIGKIDCFIVGSDQVWNPGHFDETYFLDFVPNTIKKISYGSSLGVTNIPTSLQKKYRKFLNRFSYISVRENNAAEILTNLLHREINVVIDPTLLMNSKQWESVAECAQIETDLPSQYILVYFVGNTIDHWNDIKVISYLLNLPIVLLPLENTSCSINDYIKIDYAGPYEFVSLIKNARLICTDSFHGCALSINMNKQFIAFRRFFKNDVMSQNSRLDELFEWTKVGNRYYEDNKVQDLILPMDYSVVNKIVENQRNICVKSLFSAIECDN